MMLSEDGDAYYRADLEKRLKGHDKSEWDKIIDDYNHTLKIDETGNIIDIYPFEQGYVVSKNGKYDADYTHLVNKKFDELKAQNFEANSAEFWSGVAQIFSGLGVYFASGALEVLSIMAGPPTAGTSIVAGTAVSVSGVQYGNVLIASGAVTSLSAITKTALQNGEIQVNYSSNYDSWQANRPTSKTISGRGGKLIEARVGNRKVNLRVDWEPSSGTNGDGIFQVQSGSGKSGYSLDEYIEVNTISGRKSMQYEDIELEFEHAFISDDREKGEFLRIASTHVDILTVDKRALYIMAIEVASAIDGQISEDGKQSWLSVEEFKEYHKDVLSLTYNEAVELSLEELKTMVPVRDPLWVEEERLREEYIKIHGERVYDDEEDE